MVIRAVMHAGVTVVVLVLLLLLAWPVAAVVGVIVGVVAAMVVAVAVVCGVVSCEDRKWWISKVGSKVDKSAFKKDLDSAGNLVIAFTKHQNSDVNFGTAQPKHSVSSTQTSAQSHHATPPSMGVQATVGTVEREIE